MIHGGTIEEIEGTNFIIARNNLCEGIFIKPNSTDYRIGYRVFNDEPIELFSNHTELRLDNETLLKIGATILTTYNIGVTDGSRAKLGEIKSILEIK